VKKTIYYIIAALFLFAVIGIFILSAETESTDVLNEIAPTDAAKSAYASGETIQTNDLKQSLSFDGYMRCYSIAYIPSVKEFQVSVKHNKSVYEKLGTTESEGFDFMLYNTATEEEFRDYTQTRESEGRYGYYKLVFNNIDFSENTDIELIMFPKGKKDKYSFLKLHEAGDALEVYDLSKEEIASLGD